MISSRDLFSKIGELNKLKIDKKEIKDTSFIKANIEIDFIDYYFSNHIARASMTMHECRSIKNKSISDIKEG